MPPAKPLSKLERVPLREAWKHEASDFTPWLAEAANLDALAQALGLSELEAVATEHWVGDFKLDILCTDGDQQVVIENQLAETDHKHLGQILAYAAGVDARKVIWVAESFRPEHVAALQFLNDNTTDDLSFFGVQIELWRIGDSPLAPKFEMVVKPNDWAKAGREQARGASGECGRQCVAGSPPDLRVQGQSAVCRLQERNPSIQVTSDIKTNQTNDLRFYASTGASRSAEEKAAVVAKLKAHTHTERPLGFLCEWKPTLRAKYLLHMTFSFEWNPAA
jgi:hypothetical protein